MKTILVIIIATLVTNVAIASGNLKVNFATSATEETVVEISNTQLSDFEIEVKDVYGTELYSMKTEAPRDDFKKRYDFSELEDGIYIYSVKIDKEKVTKQFEIDGGEISVMNIRKDVEPVFHRDGDMIKLSALNFQQEDVRLYVYDSNMQLLNEADLGSDMAIHQAIDVSDLRYGNYSLVLANDVEVYEHNFKVE